MTSFRSDIAKNVFYTKYAFSPNDTWFNLSERVVESVCGKTSLGISLLSDIERKELVKIINEMKFIPGGRYLYYAGRDLKAYNNCYCLKALEDTREEWARLAKKATSFLMLGGGIGIDYSIIRPRGRFLKRTGGISSGVVPLMNIINEIGRNVMQGGSRRSAIYGSLNANHDDIEEFLVVKNWSEEIKQLKAKNFDFPAPLDMTNISVNYNYKEWMDLPVFKQNVYQAMSTGEPGFSFNFGNPKETLRNACCEVTSEDDSDLCNLGSINLSKIDDLEELKKVVELASKFLYCGTIVADLPDEDVKRVRGENRKIGLGLMGISEWLLKRGYRYEINDELKSWLEVYKVHSEKGANAVADKFYLPRPKKYRAIAPTGTLSILAGTTSGIEPLYAVAYKRRYLKNNVWNYEYVVDSTAEELIRNYIVDDEDIETALSLAEDPERRIAFQYEVQKYVDMAISSTLNLPTWGSELNNEDTVSKMADIIKKYAIGLRGLTFYPDGSRGGQPLTSVPYEEAIKHKGVVYTENDVCTITGHGGFCGA